MSVLDPDTLAPLAPPLRLGEPSIARLSSDGESVIALGASTAFRLRLDRDAGRLVLDDRWRPSYGPSPGRSYGWDPVIAEHHVLWMDNGRNDTDRAMLGTGSSPDPVRLWWVRHDDERSIRSVEISGLPYGTESNPPAWDHRGGVVVAYDAGNAVLRAWRLAGDELEPLWRRDGFAHAGHLIHFPDTRELIAGDWQDRGTPRNRRVRRAMSLAGRPAVHPTCRRPRAGGPAARPRRARGARPRHRRGEGEDRGPVSHTGLSVPGARLRARPLLPVAVDDRARRGRALRARPERARARGRRRFTTIRIQEDSMADQVIPTTDPRELLAGLAADEPVVMINLLQFKQPDGVEHYKLLRARGGRAPRGRRRTGAVLREPPRRS